MEERMYLRLAVCDGSMKAHFMSGDDVTLMIAITHWLYLKGYSVWLRDTDEDCLVAQGLGGCLGCRWEPTCDDYLDCASDEESAVFWHNIGELMAG